MAIFADTGWEPQHVYDHLDWLEREVGHIIPVVRVSAGNIKEDTLRAVNEGTRVATMPVYLRNPDGEKAILRRQCTNDYKIQPINRKIRELLGGGDGKRLTKTAEVWFGISLDEAHRMKDPPHKWMTNHYPLIFEKNMTRQGCLEWMKAKGYPEPPKSACIGCPYHSDHYWRFLRDTSPDEWQDAIAFDEMVRNGLPLVRGEAYLHKSLVPLGEADLRTMREKGQLTVFDEDFGNECEGMCGV